MNIRRNDVLDGPVLRREEKHHKERIVNHDNENVYGRRKELSDVPNVDTNKKHGYKHENGGYISKGNPESNFEKNTFGKNDKAPETFDNDRVIRERKERHAYKHVPDTIQTRDNDVLDGSVLRREEKHHKELKEHHNDGYVYVRRKEVLDIPHVETDKKNGYKHEPETNENNIFGNHDRGRKERHGYKNKPETIETRNNDDRSHDRRPEGLTYLKGEKPDLYGKSRDKEEGEKPTGKAKEDDGNRSKSTYNSSLPPPYVKLNIPPPYSKPHNASNPEKMKKELDHQIDEDQHYQNDMIPLPKPKSVRRRHKHSKSSSSHDDIGSSEDARIVKRISSSRRKDRKGLQILFDDEQYHSHRDHEEKMMDKLLLHYSKKPSAYDDRKLRRKKSRSNTNSKSPSPHHHDAEMIVPPTRSISLPHEQSGEAEPKKVYARANSFQPDNQAKHVHPKLPDYDDLAARFAALRGR